MCEEEDAVKDSLHLQYKAYGGCAMHSFFSEGVFPMQSIFPALYYLVQNATHTKQIYAVKGGKGNKLNDNNIKMKIHF